ncbi:hypothetical protein Leryth_017805 [Lithospermum erythrorhizon]|nr:hypothetical protein Leryth_017805 [Lithospermum erythrorhizon]
MISRYSTKLSPFPPFLLLQNILNHYHTTSSNSHFHPQLPPNSLSPPKLPPNSLSPSKLPSNSLSTPKLSPNLPNSTHSVEFTTTTVLETLSSYTNDFQQALEFFNWVEINCGFCHATETYNKMIDILGKFFEFGTCWELIAKMGKNGVSLPNHVTFRVMFKRYVSAHLVNEAIDVFNTKLGEFGLKDQVSFLNLVDALCEYKHVVEAEEFCFKNGYGVVKDHAVLEPGFLSRGDEGGRGIDVCLDTKIYNIILRGWFKIGRWRKCREYWEEMDRNGVEKDLYSYSIYMDIVCKSGKQLKAVMLYKEMKKKGIGLDVVAYNTVIRSIGILDGVDASVRILKEMVELGCQPNVVTYNIVLKLYCEAGKYSDTCKMLNDMCKKGCEPNVITFHGLFGSLQKPREIMQLFDKMVEMGIRPRMDTYVMLMRKFGRWGFLRPVLTIWKKIEEHGVSPDEFAYNALIDALVQKGMIDMARMYDEEMFKKGLSAKPRAELETKPATVT